MPTTLGAPGTPAPGHPGGTFSQGRGSAWPHVSVSKLDYGALPRYRTCTTNSHGGSLPGFSGLRALNAYCQDSPPSPLGPWIRS